MYSIMTFYDYKNAKGNKKQKIVTVSFYNLPLNEYDYYPNCFYAFEYN